MNRELNADALAPVAVPHMRGDEPFFQTMCNGARARSPHAWG